MFLTRYQEAAMTGKTYFFVSLITVLSAELINRRQRNCIICFLSFALNNTKQKLRTLTITFEHSPPRGTMSDRPVMRAQK